MLQAVSLWIGSLLVTVPPTNEMVRTEIAQHIRTMIDAKNNGSIGLPEDSLHATPLKFCRMLIDDVQHELILELKSNGITLEQIERARELHKNRIAQEDFRRRLLPTEKPSQHRVKMVVSELCQRWHVENKIRVLNYGGGSCMGSARISELFFDEEWWENEFDNNEDVLRFIAGHELRHIYTEDLALGEALDDLQKKIKNKRKAQKVQKIITSLNKLAEVQADTESALDSARSLKGYECWTSQYIRGCGDSASADHPLMSHRLRLASLLQQLNDIYRERPRKKRKIE